MAKVSINLATGSLQKQEIIVGIDLGTTNSLVAFSDPDGQPRVINDAGKGVLVPSVVHFTPQGDILVGNEAKEYLVTDPANTIFSVKRLLGKTYSDVGSERDYLGYRILDDETQPIVKIAVGEIYYTPIQLSALILRELKQRAEHSLKTPVNRAVITVPAYFNDSQRQATKDAGKLAGLDVLRIVNEPTAAALAYGINTQNSNGKTICVYDLGGGTFDVSVLSIQDGIFEVLSTNGDTHLGGDDFDRAIVDYWLNVNGAQLAGASANPGLMQLLRTQAEEAKVALSTQNVYNHTTGGYDFAITRQTFNQLIRPLIERTISACRHAVAASGVQLSQIEQVIMVGGSTRVPAVYEAVQEYFGRQPQTNLNPDEVVALGAAIQADVLAGNRSDVLLLDVTPLSLGIETMGGLMDVIIDRNTKVPYKAGRQYTTSVDGQVNLKVSVYQGERDLVSENRKLAEFILSNIPAMPAGLPKIDINFILDADGILKVEARELRSGTSQSIQVKPGYGLTDEEVEQMLMDSLTNARADVDARMLIEARESARQLAYTAAQFVQKNRDMLSADEITQTDALIEKINSLLPSAGKDQLIAATEELNNYTRPFAERLMDTAVAAAMRGKSITGDEGPKL